ncbi:hypothetical protein T484DRAFT_1785707, partial [Baffinella frigidus]
VCAYLRVVNCKSTDQQQVCAYLEVVCAYLGVVKCKYCARVGETLKFVAEQYNFDTNWLRLWNYNADLEDPDHLLRSFLPINIGMMVNYNADLEVPDRLLRSFLPISIGSTYRVQPGDTLGRIAARLRTTVKKVLEVNPDMHTDEIDPGQEICIMPCTENPYKDDPYNPYNPGGINGLSHDFVESVPRLSKDPPYA